MVMEMEKRIFYKIDSLKERSIAEIGVFDDEQDFSNISPFKLIFDDANGNEYLKSIYSQVHTAIPYYNGDIWINACSRNNNIYNIKRKTELATIYVQMHSFKRANLRSFIFWSLVAACIYKKDFEKNLSLIVDFVRIFEVKEDELEDILHVVKAVFGEEDKGYTFKNDEVHKLFSTVLSYLSSK